MRFGIALIMIATTVPFTVLLVKAKGWMFLLSLALSPVGLFVALVGAFRLAKPHSWWARHIYRDHEMVEARRRYGDAPAARGCLLANIGWGVQVLFTALAVLYALGVVDGPS
jgi:hypothetical protein